MRKSRLRGDIKFATLRKLSGNRFGSHAINSVVEVALDGCAFAGGENGSALGLDLSLIQSAPYDLGEKPNMTVNPG